MPIKLANGTIEPFAGEACPSDRPLISSLDFLPRLPYFVGEWNEEEKRDWLDRYESEK